MRSLATISRRSSRSYSSRTLPLARRGRSARAVTGAMLPARSAPRRQGGLFDHEFLPRWQFERYHAAEPRREASKFEFAGPGNPFTRAWFPGFVAGSRCQEFLVLAALVFADASDDFRDRASEQFVGCFDGAAAAKSDRRQRRFACGVEISHGGMPGVQVDQLCFGARKHYARAPARLPVDLAPGFALQLA